MNCLIRVHPICNNIGSIGVHFGIELAFYIIRYLACLNVLVKCYQTPAQRMCPLTNSVIDTVMHYHIYHYNRPSAIGHQPSAIGNHRWYLAKKAVPIYIYIYIHIYMYQHYRLKDFSAIICNALSNYHACVFLVYVLKNHFIYHGLERAREKETNCRSHNITVVFTWWLLFCCTNIL